MGDGTQLYRIVEQYSALGDHRTGTAVDAATADWWASQLDAMGATVQRLPYSFPRYDARWSLTAGGQLVTSIPLFYEGVGEVETDNPLVVEAAANGATVPDMPALTARARAEGRPAIVLVTKSNTGLLTAINREPVARGGLPTLCVAPADAERLMRGPVRLEVSAAIVEGQSTNVLGTFGDAPWDRRVLLLTPMTGWFTCAAERGSGIAVCLELARALSREAPVAIIGTSGHELEYLGVKRWVASGPERPAAVFHFGANVAGAAPGPSGALAPIPQPYLRARLPSDRHAALRQAFAALDATPAFLDDAAANEPRSWIGESTVLHALGTPLISWASPGPLFHAPEDTPARATSPAVLAAAFDAALAAARCLVP